MRKTEQATVEELRAVDALTPFAYLDIRHLTGAPDDRVLWQLNETPITVGDIRAAKRAMGMPSDEFDASKVSGPVELPPLGHFTENA